MTVTAAVAAEIRRLFYAEHWKCGTICTQLGVHSDVVARVLGSFGPKVGSPRPDARVLEPYTGFVDETLVRYPRLVSTRIYDMLVERGYTGSIRTPRASGPSSIASLSTATSSTSTPSPGVTRRRSNGQSPRVSRRADSPGDHRVVGQPTMIANFYGSVWPVTCLVHHSVILEFSGRSKRADEAESRSKSGSVEAAE
jgi:hypothetical protein